jgi:uncharacterized protein YvpB
MNKYWFKDVVTAIGIGLILSPLIGYGVFYLLAQVQAAEEPTNNQIVLDSQTPAASEVFIQNPWSDETILSDSKDVLKKITSNKAATAPGPEKVILNVPLIKQIYNLTCEVTSLQMALKYRGIDTTQEDLMQKIGYAHPTQKTVRPDGQIIWADPDEGFVGSEKGVMYTAQEGLKGATGWGVNAGPVAKLAGQFRPGSFAKKQAGTEDLKSSLRQGNPVIMWHVRDDAPIKDHIYYSTPAGKQIKMVKNHVNLVVGFQTGTDNQTIYYINDPHFGNLQLNEPDLVRMWSKFDYSMVSVA